MDLTVTIGTRDIACEWAEHSQQLIRGIMRPTIEFTFPDGAIKLDTLRNLVTDETKTETITIVNNGESEGGIHPRETLVGYTVRADNCISLRTVEVEPATYEHPPVYADKIVLQLGMRYGWEV